jgi:excisionase family DNA binding protein
MTKSNHQIQEYLTTSELAEILGVSRIAIHKRIVKGDIKAIKIGRTYAIPKSYVSEAFGREISPERKRLIEKAVHRVVKEYGEVLIKLGKE